MKRGLTPISRATESAGLKRSTWPTWSTRPRSRARAAMARASSSVAAMGFSTSTWIPRSRSGQTTAWCAEVGTATETASTSAGSSSALASAGTPSGSATPRAWCRPRCPTPTTAARSGAPARAAALAALAPLVATQRLPVAAVAPGLLAAQELGQLAHERAVVVDQVVRLLVRRPPGATLRGAAVAEDVYHGLRRARAQHADLVDHAH